jgi:hypothetical protein
MRDNNSILAVFETTLMSQSLLLWSALLGAILIVVLVWFLKGRRRNEPLVLRRTRAIKTTRGNKIYLLGPKGCGKTRVFLQLTDPTFSKVKDTVTSVHSNEAALLGDPQLTLVDTPGHERLRWQIAQLTAVKGVVLWCHPVKSVDWEYTVHVASWCGRNQIPTVHIYSGPGSELKQRLEQILDGMRSQEGLSESSSKLLPDSLTLNEAAVIAPNEDRLVDQVGKLILQLD